MLSTKNAIEAAARVCSKMAMTVEEWGERFKAVRQARRERIRRENRLSLTAKAFGISIDEVAAIEQACIVKHMVNQEVLNEVDDTTLIDTLYFACLYGSSCQDYYEEIGNLLDKGYDLRNAMSRYRVDLAKLIYGEEEKTMADENKTQGITLGADGKPIDEPIYVREVNTTELRDEPPKQDWGPTPWRWDDEAGCIMDADGVLIIFNGTLGKRDAERAIACANACAGIPTMILERGPATSMYYGVHDVDEYYEDEEEKNDGKS